MTAANDGEEHKNEAIRHHKQLRVWQDAMDASMQIFELTKMFPREGRYSLTDQIRRSSRSVAANVTEAWIKRRYEAAFVLKLNDAMAEAAETQTWLEFCFRCGYLDAAICQTLNELYQRITGQLIKMSQRPEDWTLKT